MKISSYSIFTLIIVLLAFTGCETDKTNSIDVVIKLVDTNDVIISIFEEHDSVLFKFYLINHLGHEITYVRPNAEIMEYLRVHKQTSTGQFDYIGNPWVPLTGIDFSDTIKNNEVKLLGSVPTTTEFHWPELVPGNYYVGDTFKITIEDERLFFKTRIYFTIY